jgi:hypothetical protein
MGKSRSLTEIEDPDHEEFEAVQAPAQTAVWFQRNIYPECSLLSRELHLLSKTTARFTKASLRKFRCCCPLLGAPANPTTSSADPSSAPDTATASSHPLEYEQVTASARVARAFVILDCLQH